MEQNSEARNLNGPQGFRRLGGLPMMSKTFRQALLAGWAVGLLCGLVMGQQPANSNSKPAVRQAAKSSAAPKTSVPRITLLDATRVSTSEALKAAAQVKQTARTAKKGPALKGVIAVKPGVDSGVVELQPLAHASPSGGKALVAPAKDSKDSFLKNVHGDLYGASAAGPIGANAESGAVGATSKGGKTSIYVETDHSRGPFPQ
jgi:hypothetical protein